MGQLAMIAYCRHKRTFERNKEKHCELPPCTVHIKCDLPLLSADIPVACSIIKLLSSILYIPKVTKQQIHFVITAHVPLFQWYKVISAFCTKLLNKTFVRGRVPAGAWGSYSCSCVQEDGNPQKDRAINLSLQQNSTLWRCRTELLRSVHYFLTCNTAPCVSVRNGALSIT